ncbi:acyltransferase family protein [Arthrobacter sp. NEB 688]|uniref:acyltransferase family protein n=1 Tax=Arthrobacter sp. NEB 688 TaxID=904039 RepID=UPI001566A319|nr:acyltransferase family protein [Arthrobacter sp. NEB 688]QKE84882.1 acyltransferase [Arthrobacter sp. NEB 688]
MSTAPPVSPPSTLHGVVHRSLPVDGLRGAAIALVVLFHAHVVWPTSERPPLGSLGALFQGGNIAVSAFYVISGYLVTERMLAATAQRRVWGPLLYLEQRTVRIALQLYVLLAAVLVAWRLDPTDTTSSDTTIRSVLATATFTFNTYVRDHALAARSDLGPLYFLSIDVQFFVVAAVVVILLARRRRLLVGVAVVALVATFWWRWQLYLDEGWFRAALTTTARMDGLLAGAAAAALLQGRPPPAWLRRHATALAGSGLLLLVGLLLSCVFVGIDGYFGLQGVLATLAATALVVGLANGAAADGLGSRLLSARPLVVLGQASLTVFLWHMPVFQVVQRHAGTWDTLPRLLVTAVALGAVVVGVHRFVVPAAEGVVRRVFGSRRLSRLAGRAGSGVGEARGEAARRDG